MSDSSGSSGMMMMMMVLMMVMSSCFSSVALVGGLFLLKPQLWNELVKSFQTAAAEVTAQSTQSLPPGTTAKPSPKSCTPGGGDKVFMYDDVDFKGAKSWIRCGEFPKAMEQSNDIKFGAMGWNDKMSSVKVPKNLKLLLYQDINFGGQVAVVTGNVSNLHKFDRPGPRADWGDSVSSAKVISINDPSPSNSIEIKGTF